jgi:hypothetical protein
MSIDIDTDMLRRSVERAVELALGIGWFSEYERWARDWLTGIDRSAGSARLAFDRVRQWVGFGGESWASRCCLNAAAAAEELARGHHEHASTSANAAIRHADFVANPPPERDRPGEPKQIFDDWNRDPGGMKRGRSFDPREV